MKHLKLFLLSLAMLACSTYAQNLPSDFKLQATTAGTAPWSDMEIVNIYASGQAEFIMTKGSPPQTIIDTTFTVNTSYVQQLWQTIQNYDFFSLDSSYIDTLITGGSLAIVTVTANGKTKQVFVRDTVESETQGIIDSVNTLLPGNYKLNYTPPEEIYATPQDPCRLTKKYFNKPFKRNPLLKRQNKLKLNNKLISSITDGSQIAHGGVEIGYEMPLAEAVITGRATLKSKGDYFGDAVSITGDNTKNFPPPGDNTIVFKFNLEFYGACDNKDAEEVAEDDIYNKWNGKTTSSGKKIKVEFSTLSNPGSKSPLWVSTYDYIQLKCGNGRSQVGGPGHPWSDPSTVATWYPESSDVGLFGHEAGHLMGLSDHYVDWRKNSLGVWQNVKTRKTLSSADFTDLYNHTHGSHFTHDQLDKFPNLSIPLTGDTNDVMANHSKPPTQSEIDKLAAKAGLIIHTKAGDVISNTDNTAQNLVITHTQDLFVEPGHKKTLNGIFTACIDAFKNSPYSDSYLDVAPSLDEWQGIPSAQYMLKLVQYADSLIYYCEDDFDIQDAVWRISDNEASSNADTIFKKLGINLGSSILHFPKMENNLTNDSISTVYIPDELLIPDIQPKSVQASIGENLSFNVNILKPTGYNFQTSYTWSLSTPNGSSSKISSGGSFVPDRNGVYTVSLKMNINGSNVVDTTGYVPPGAKSFVVVPDKYTETFEHQGLSDKFPWQTNGNVRWYITNKGAQTGTYCATTGNVLSGQISTLSINVDLPKDTTITFAAKLFSPNGGELDFNDGSNNVDYWDETMDWHIYTYQLSAGKHYLSWTLTDGPSSAWIDNVFFPPNSVVTGISTKQNVPFTFRLYQNYPNPFNPTTVIKYSLPKAGIVKLTVYNDLGQKVSELINGFQSSGEHNVEFNAGKLSSGIYFYRLEENDLVQTRKMILLK